MKRHKSKKITQSARGKSCISCGKVGETRACHYNGIWQHAFGKGRGIKCHDLATADFCQKCDQDHSEGVNIYESEEERDQMWLKYIMLTNIRRFEDGVLKT